MYKASPLGQGLAPTGTDPPLESTNRFWQVLKTIPEGECIPMSLVKLGLLCDQLESRDESIVIVVSTDSAKTRSEAVVLPETLTEIRKLLLELAPELDRDTKTKIGRFCEDSNLNRPPEAGCERAEIEKLDSVKSIKQYPGFKVKDKKELDNINRSLDSDQEPKFDSGKSVTYRGGERITGKNPFADPDRLKDTGLHHGGG